VALTVNAGDKKEFDIVPEGVYTARCIKLIDLGTQDASFGEEVKSRKKVYVTWELLDDTVKMSDGRPYAISKTYTASLHEKAGLRKDLQAWRGKRFTESELEGFDLKNVLGTYCLIQVSHTEKNDRVYANIDAIMATKEKPKGINELVHFDIDEPDMAVYEAMPDWLKEKIQLAPEWKKTDKPQQDVVFEVGEEPVDLDTIPF
jgi:hypothetical protein